MMNNVKLAADAVVLAGKSTDLRVLLIKRGWPPFKDMWALPGGYMENGERFEDTATRELGEETGFFNESKPVLVGVYDTPNRDPRGRVISVAYLTRVPEIDPRVKGEDDATDAKWVQVNQVLNDPDALAFDHRSILVDALLLIDDH